jgi:hypothetical protein
VCRRTDEKRNADIIQDLKISSSGEKVKEYKHNYLEHVLRMPTYRIPIRIFDSPHRKRREINHR